MRQAAVVLLYRLLFLLYAEDRNSLPVDHEGYRSRSLSKVRNEVADAIDQARLFVRYRRLLVGRPQGPVQRQVIAWNPEIHQEHYERYATPDCNPGVTEWDGLLLDGWMEYPTCQRRDP